MGRFSLPEGGFLELLKRHYSSTHYERSEKQLEREQWLIPGVVRFNRFFLMPAAVIIQVCCGSLYAWSGYNLPMERYILGANNAVDRSVAANVFYVAVAVFGVAAAFLGPWLERNGPWKGAFMGATLFFLGNLLTALGVYVHKFELVFFGYGFVGGAGLGISYISPVSPLQKWFPDLRGVAAGLAVCGFGAGSIFSPYTQRALIGPDFAKTGVQNLGLPLTFVILGSCYYVLMVLAAFVLRMPPPGYTVNGIDIHTVKGAEGLNATATPRADSEATLEVGEGKGVTKTVEVDNRTATVQPVTPAPNPFSLTLAESLASREYIMMYIMFFCAEITGLLIISKIQSIVSNQLKRDTQTAANINSILGGCNLLGRLVIPTLSDVLKTRKPFFILSLAAQTVFLAILPGSIESKNYGLTLACAFIIAFFYGGGFGLIPAFLADQFGSKNVGATHGVILTAWSIGGVCGGLVFSKVYSNTLAYLTSRKAELGDDYLLTVYTIDFRWILAFTILGFCIALFIPTNLRDRRLPKTEGERFRFRAPNGRLVKVVNGNFVMVTQEEEDQEWEKYTQKVLAGNQ
ncbi:hypothetical protein HK097_008323 [Rhizophlyctis rosea]|uniref:Major facilitator superfamily (MFS) profile domain-containing protein n=1 Tax=Rhizophlyctis rosea TaxID=64517 RepID=A0AAD5SD30_9FUNG|nr:hypothetical protein HK097_008323 [Rhizophlyctis rosea]